MCFDTFCQHKKNIVSQICSSGLTQSIEFCYRAKKERSIHDVWKKIYDHKERKIALKGREKNTTHMELLESNSTCI